MKCISLIKLTSILNTLFLLEWNFFHWEKGWNDWRRQCTRSAQKVHKKVHKKFFYCTDIYVLFHVFAILLSVIFKDFFFIKTLFQIFHVFVLLYKDKLKVQHEMLEMLFGQEWDAGYQKRIIFLTQEMVSFYNKFPSGIITGLKLW